MYENSNVCRVTAQIFYAFVTLLVMINPIEAAATFAVVTVGRSDGEKAAIALRSTIVATIILLAFGFAGEALLRALGISFPAFRIAGGLLLLRVAFNMVFERSAGNGDHPAERTDDPSVFPLAIPIITGPGALTAIVALDTQADSIQAGLIALTAIALVIMAITYGAMRSSMFVTKVLGATGVDAIGRVMGIIVAAISIQLIVDGIGKLLPLFAAQMH